MEDIVEQVKTVHQLIAQISHSKLEKADGLSRLKSEVDEIKMRKKKNEEMVEESEKV
ncbi:hypothetical protein I8R61_34445 [Pseudomonas aeruginosa]|nr:hypothetical protein [Pseudomonas aeruginosa]